MKSFNISERSDVHNPQNTYFVTISPISKSVYTPKSRLDEAYDYLIKNLPCIPKIKNKVYEIGSKYSDLHIHFIMLIPYAPYFKRLIRTIAHDYSLQLYYSPITYNRGLESYLSKQVVNKYEQDELLANHYYCHPKSPLRII